MPAARDITRDFNLCRTPTRHPDECDCPTDGRQTGTVPGIDHWNDQEQPR